VAMARASPPPAPASGSRLQLLYCTHSNGQLHRTARESRRSVGVERGWGGWVGFEACVARDRSTAERWRAGTDWNRPPTQSAGREVGESRSAQRNGSKKQPREGGGMVKEEDLLGAVVGVGGLCGGVGAGGEGGGIEARGVVVVAGGAERRERVGVGVAVGVVRERRGGREAGAGLAPAPADERAGEARADEDDEEDAEAEARQRQRHARRHAGPHRAGPRGEGGACGAVDWCRVPSAGCRGSLSCCACAGAGRAGGCVPVYCGPRVGEERETTECAVAHSALGLWTSLGLGLGCLQVCNGRRYNTPHWYKIVEHILLL
jgi:hypothetical protein